MPATLMGIDPTKVDTSATLPIGYEIADPRGGILAGNTIKYVRANATIAVNNVVCCDVAFATTTERHATVVNSINSGASTQMIEGVSDCATVSVTSGQFFWITVKGRATAKTAAVTAATNPKLGVHSVSGTLTAITAATPSNAEVIAGLAAASGKQAMAMTDTGTPSAGLSFIILS